MLRFSMKSSDASTHPPALERAPAYRACYAAQLGAIGRTRQRKLRQTSVLIGGVGGLGAAIASTLVGSGIGRVLLVDPQTIRADNLNRYPFATAADIGR